MKYYVGLDVSMDETSVCVMDEGGRVFYEAKVPTEPDDIAVYLRSSGLEYERVGLESGPCSPWLYQGLIDKGLPAICIDARHASAALKAQNVKTDKNDAMGIAHIMRTGWYRLSHVKSDHSQKTRVLLNSRKTLLGKRLELDNHIRGTLKVFGLKVGATTASRFDKRVRDLITKTGDRMMRAHLYEAAQVLMRRTSKTTELKVWGQRIAKRSCKKCAYVVIARKLAVIMHRMWVDGTEFKDGGAHA